MLFKEKRYHDGRVEVEYCCEHTHDVKPTDQPIPQYVKDKISDLMRQRLSPSHILLTLGSSKFFLQIV